VADIHYVYIGNGVPNGTIKSGDTVYLAHGQSITITGLPAGITYIITEADYSDDGYNTISTGATDSITTDTTQTASFTNTKNVSHIAPDTGNKNVGENGMPKTGDNQAGNLAKLGLFYFSVALVALSTADFALRKKYSRKRK